jgi:hypothetical protein
MFKNLFLKLIGQYVNWSKIPIHLNYYAVDSFGEHFAFPDEPVPDSKTGTQSNSNAHRLVMYMTRTNSIWHHFTWKWLIQKRPYTSGILTSISNGFRKMEARGWDKIYWAIDIHDTIHKSTYQKINGNINHDLYLYAEDVLIRLSRRKDCVLILYSSGHTHDLDNYIKFFERKGINFKYVNENPEVSNNEYARFESKFYFNVLLDDKAGFNPETDWENILEYIKNL